MHIVFDLDNTIIDELGYGVRPGIVSLLKMLKKDGHVLSIWTNSPAQRAKDILREKKLVQYFHKFVYREDYDPENVGIGKDIRKIGGDILIDDDYTEIKYVSSVGKIAIAIKPYRKNGASDKEELIQIYKMIRKKSGFFGFLT